MYLNLQMFVMCSCNHHVQTCNARLQNFAKKDCQAKLVMTTGIIKLNSNLSNGHCECDSSHPVSCNYIWLPCLLAAVYMHCVVDSLSCCVCFWVAAMIERQNFIIIQTCFTLTIDFTNFCGPKRSHVQCKKYLNGE